jgi:hypothetical protein
VAHWDARAFSEAFPDTPLAGFYCGGEVGPRAVFRESDAGAAARGATGGAALQAFTCMFGLFIVPPPSKTSSGLLQRLDQGVEAAFKHYCKGEGQDTKKRPAVE